MSAASLDFVCSVLSIRDEFTDPYAGLWDSVDWRTDNEFAPVTFWVNCNDLFAWACADCEEITPENFTLLKASVDDVAAALGAPNPHLLPRGTPVDDLHFSLDGWEKVGSYAADLFCARSRKMRPQRPCYKRYPAALHPLFDACGAARDPKSEG